jgi:hypothetical protein
MSMTTKLIARQLIRHTVLPDARRIFLDALKTGFDTVTAAKDAGQLALQRHTKKFPVLEAKEGREIVDLYAKLCEEAFEDAYIQSIQPTDEVEELVN